MLKSCIAFFFVFCFVVLDGCLTFAYIHTVDDSSSDEEDMRHGELAKDADQVRLLIPTC